MKKVSMLVITLAVLLFASCEKEDQLITDQQKKKTESVQTTKSIFDYLSYGDVVTINYTKTRGFLTGESNGDATINKFWNTLSPNLNNVWLPWAKFKIINPNKPNSVEDIHTGDEIAFQSLQNNFYLTAESWGDDVSVNRPAIGTWEKWKIYSPSNQNIGNTIFTGNSNNDCPISLKSVWNKYLRSDNLGFAKAFGSFDSTVSILDNNNTFFLTIQ